MLNQTNKMLHRFTVLLILFGMSHALMAGDYAVQADYLYKFTRYVKWPGGGSLQICVVGANPFGKLLNQAVANKRIKGRKLVARHLPGDTGVNACNILFISAELGNTKVSAIIKGAGPGVLTVSDRAGFIRQGGMVSFYREGKHIRFVISNTAAKKAGLQLSAQLLKLARKVL